MELETTIKLKIFNEHADSCFSIFHNSKKMFSIELDRNTEKEIYFMQTLNYEEFGLHRLSLNWSGKEECENKYFNLDKIVVNQQKVPVHTIRSKPHENDYIKGLRKTDAGRNMLKQISLYPGYRHGWYGDYDIDFLVGDNQYFKKLSKESIQVFLGIKKERIYVDKDYQHSYHTV